MFRRRISGILHSEDGVKIGIGDGIASKAVVMLGIWNWEVKAELSRLTSVEWRYILMVIYQNREIGGIRYGFDRRGEI